MVVESKVATRALLAGTSRLKLKQLVFTGQAGVLGVGVAVVVTTGGCDMAPKVGIVTCRVLPPVGVASCMGERVTAAIAAVVVFTAVVTWPVSVAGLVGAAPSGASGRLPRFVPIGTLKAMVGL